MKTLKDNILNIYGELGQKWLNELEDLVSDKARQYELSELIPISNMSFNYVARGVAAGKTPIVLKLGLNSEELLKEAQCLKAYDGNFAPKVLADSHNMILMEYANPGTTLREYFPRQEQESVSILCNIIQRLQSVNIPKSHKFKTLHVLTKNLENKLDIPEQYLVKARKLREELLGTTKNEVLLHGDLHHDNILKNNNDWLVIDPKGFIGDPTFELAAFICNPIPNLLAITNPRKIITKRIELCAKNLNLPEQRIFDWLYVKTVLCWSWSVNDNLDPSYWHNLLKLFG